MTDHDAIAARVRQDRMSGTMLTGPVYIKLADMADAYLDLYDEAKRLRADMDQGALDYCDLMTRHDAHFVAWQSAKSRAEKAEDERVAEWNKRREAEASRDLEKAVCATFKAEREALRAALESIAKNTCCEGCQEAALVARQALKGLTND